MLLAAAWAPPALAQGDDRPRITVSGEALVKVQPDEVVLTFGIETRDAEILAAKEQNNDVLRRALAALAEAGVAARQVQTDHLSIQPRYDDDYHRREIEGFIVRNTLVVTLTDTAAVEGVVTRALQAGVNHLHGIDFRTTELKTHRERARELALEAAREKAGKMAAVLGRAVGDPVQIGESYSGSHWVLSSWSWWGHGRGQAMSQNVVQNAPQPSGEVGDTVALGTIPVRASVSVAFLLEPPAETGGRDGS